MMEWLLVGLGGMLGALLRFSVAKLLVDHWHHPFPLSTFIVNMVGSFLLGWVILLDQAWLQLFLGAGGMGALTTFSTFLVEGHQLIRNGKRLISLAYLVGSICLGMVLAFLSHHFL